MKTKIEVLNHIAQLNEMDKAATVELIRQRTFLRLPTAVTMLVEMDEEGLIEDYDGYWLTEKGWEVHEKNQPRKVPEDLLLSHTNYKGD